MGELYVHSMTQLQHYRIDFGVTPDDFGNPHACPGPNPNPITTQYVLTQSIVFGSAVSFPGAPIPGVEIIDDIACSPPCRSSGEDSFTIDWWCEFTRGVVAGAPECIAGVDTFSAEICYIDETYNFYPLMIGYNSGGGVVASAYCDPFGGPAQTLTITDPARQKQITFVQVVSSQDPAGLSVDYLYYDEPTRASISCSPVVYSKQTEMDYFQPSPTPPDTFHLASFGFEGCSAMGWTTHDLTCGYGDFADLYRGAAVLQEDLCVRNASCFWGFFDQPSVTNYGCGGWALQGAIPYGPDEDGLYLNNEIWSPQIPVIGMGSDLLLEFDVYRDLSTDALVFYYWKVRSWTDGYPDAWRNDVTCYYGQQRDWIRQRHNIGHLVDMDSADNIQIALGVVDLCSIWCGVYGSGACHSHAPLFDNVHVARINNIGPRFTVHMRDMFQDNFPEDGSITGFSRCDMAQDIIPSNKKTILPGDSLKIMVTDPNGLAADNTGGRAGKAVYVFVSAQDRHGNIRPYTGLQMQSPDYRAWATDPNTGFLRWPLVPDPTGSLPGGWYAFRTDQVYTTAGGVVKDTYCADLMDLAAGPDGPPYHPNENWAANTGVFRPGDVIRYFLGAMNTLNQWSFITRDYLGQGAWFRTNDLTTAVQSPMEWSVLPDAGRLPGDLGDILFVDDADDRGGPAQIYFDWAFKYYNLTHRVDRFDVLGPSWCVGNSLASRVKNVANQMIGTYPEIYQKVLWNCSDLAWGLMGDGGVPNGGMSAEKSDDFDVCYTFLNMHPDNPGWAYWGDDVAKDWATLTGPKALSVKATYMNQGVPAGDQRTMTGVTSPRVLPVTPLPPAPWLRPVESFYAYGGCPTINDFDVPSQAGLSQVAHKYYIATSGPNASLSQWKINSVGDTARFFLAGFGFNFIADDDVVYPPDYVAHLREILLWFENAIGAPIGIDPVAYESRLENNTPNPFNPTTTIKYSIASAGRVTLKIYNAAGQLVKTLVDEELSPLEVKPANWNGLNDQGQPVASGVYFYKLTAKNFSQTKKMVLIK